ncbi:MAG: PilN domain-containing protein [Candidatus Aureabacteria bacterium]|nr:PilN domain-containing protein [Candidatus Auribacterota bacterium]
MGIENYCYHIFELHSDRFDYFFFDSRKSSVCTKHSVQKKQPGDFFSLLEIHDDERVVFLLPRAMFIEKQLLVPSLLDDETIKMAKLQAMKLVPFVEEEILTYPHVFEKQENGFSSVLLYVLEKSRLLLEIQPFLTAGIVPDKLLIRPLIFPLLIQALIPHEEQINCFVSTYPDQVELGIYGSSGLKYSRSIKGLHQNPSESRLLINEIIRSFQYAQLKHGLEYTRKCYLLGEFNAVELDYFKHESIQFVHFPISDEKRISVLAQHNEPYPFVIEDVIARKKTKQAQLISLRVIMLFLFGFLVYFARLTVAEYMLQNQLISLNHEIKKTKVKAEKALSLKEQVATACSHYSTSDCFIKAVTELYRIIPGYVQLSLFQVKNTIQIIIKGTTQKGVTELVEKLEGSPVFQNVALIYQNKLTTENNNAMEFHLSCELESQGDSK